MKKLIFFLLWATAPFLALSCAPDSIEPDMPPQVQKHVLVIAQSSYQIAREGGHIDIKVRHNTDFNVRMDVEWIKQIKTRTYTEETLTFTVEPNTTYDNREGTLTFTSKDGRLKQEVKVYQVCRDGLIVSPMKQTFDCEAHTFNIEVKANVEFEVKLPSEAAWLHHVNTRALSSHTVQIRVDANDGHEARSAAITVRSKDGGLSEKVTVTQMQKDALVIAQASYQIAREGGNIDLKVGHNVDFNVSIDVDWIRQVKTKAYTEETLTFTVEANPTYDDREGTVTFTSKDGRLKQEVKVCQVCSDGLIVSPTEQSFDCEAHSFNIEVKANVEFEVVMPEAVWLHYVDTRALSSHTVQIGVDANEGYEVRSAEITVRSKDGSFSETVTVNQMQKDALVIAQPNYQIGIEGGSIHIKVCHNAEFHTDLSVSWIRQAKTKAYTEEVLTFIVEANPMYEKRQGVITFTSKDGRLKQEVTVRQDAPSVLVETVFGMQLKMVRVEGGTFTMGATSEQGRDAWRDEKPAHRVTLSDYYIGLTEVTFEQFAAFVDATGYETDADKDGYSVVWALPYWVFMNGVNWRCDGYGNPRGVNDSTHPVIHVSWNDAAAYCQWLSQQTGKRYALPTEAQWEYAARGGNKSRGYKYSGGADLDEVAWYEDNSGSPTHPVSGLSTHPVGTKAPNELGLYDMSGNVEEWCADWSSNYSADSQTDPQGPSSGFRRVTRGGSAYCGAKTCRVSARGSADLDFHNSDSGFRVALPLSSFASITLDKTKLVFAAAGGVESVTLTSKWDWTVRTSADWLTIVPASGQASKTGVTVKLTAKVNEGEEERSATVVFTTDGVEKVLTVTQMGMKSSSVLVETAFGMQLRLVRVEGGTFWMGAQSTDPDGQNYDSEAGPDEAPVHQVTLSDYYIGEFEVTQGQWQAVMGRSVYQQRDKADSSWSMRGVGDNYPMYYVHYYEAKEFVRRLNKRTGKRYTLPTEAQWEYAARGGNKSMGYKYSGSNSISSVAWYGGNSGAATHPVGTKPYNELGLHDMSGNVYEWCADWYGKDYYQDSPSTNPQGPSKGSFCVLRGGGWNAGARSCRVSDRDYNGLGSRYYDSGFRLVLLP